VVRVDVIGGELGCDAAPRERQPCPDHRHGRRRAAHEAHYVRQHRQQAEPDERECDRLVTDVRGRVRWRGERRAEHPEHDGRNRHVLVPACALSEHPLADEHQHEQAGRERRLHDHQRGQQERENLQRKAEDR